MYDLLWAICRSTKISNSRPPNFYPLSHFPSYFIFNEGEIKAKEEIKPSKRGFFLEFQKDGETYVLEPNINGNSVSEKVKNTTLNFL